jgi:hypothetical protein
MGGIITDCFDWRIFGDGKDMTLLMNEREGVLLPNVIITEMSITGGGRSVIDTTLLEDAGGYSQFLEGIAEPPRLTLELRPSGPVTYMVEGLVVPLYRDVNNMSIRDLFRVINSKIDGR